MSDEAELVKRLREESTRLSCKSLGNSFNAQDAGISANLAEEAADAITKLTAERDAAWEAGRDAAAAIGDAMAIEFLSDEYSLGQPLASFGERFACKQMAERIRALKKPE